MEWKGKDADKTRSLIKTFLSTLQQQYPEIKNARYDFGTGRFLDNRDMPIYGGSEQGFDKAAKSERGRTARAGEATLRRGIFLQSLVSSTGGERSDLLGDLLNRGNSVRDSGLGKLFAGDLPNSNLPRVPNEFSAEARDHRAASGKNLTYARAGFGSEGTRGEGITAVRT